MTIESQQQLQQVVGQYRQARIIQSAVKLRLFDHIRKNAPATAAKVARETGYSIRGVDIILDALVALGLVRKNDNQYENSDLAEELLVSDSVSMVRYSIEHSEQIYRRWANLPEAVRDGFPHGRDESHVMGNQENNRVFIRAMHARGLERGRCIASALDLNGVRRVGDVGGGAGSYLIALAEKIPDADFTLFDLELTLNSAREIIQEHFENDNLSLSEKTPSNDNLSLLPNFHLVNDDIFQNTGPFGNDFDLILLSNIIHIVGPDENIALLKRIHESLRPGGRCVIQDFFLDDTATSPPGAALFAVVMLVSTETGRAWRESEIREWVRKAGFTSSERLDAGTDSDVLVAIK